MENLTNTKDIAGDEGFLDEHEDLFWVYDKDQCFWMKYPFQGRSLRKGGKSKGGKGKQGKSKGQGSTARRFFWPYRKGGGKGKKSRPATSTLATASCADCCTAVDAASMVATCLPGLFQWQGELFPQGELHLPNDAFDYDTTYGTANNANAD